MPAIPGADPTFGDGGLTTVNFDNAMTGLTRVVADGNGNYVAVGGTQEAILVVRVRSDGTLDPAFGTQGSVQLPWGVSTPGVQAGNYGVALQGDGKIVIAARLGQRIGGAGGVVVRLTTDGKLDTSFGGKGYVVPTALTNALDAVAIQSDGKIVAGGGALYRFGADGTLDTSFGTNGVATSVPGITDLAIAPDGGVVVVVSYQRTISRFTASGVLDTSFGTSGHVTPPSTGFVDTLPALAVQPDGKIVVAGSLTASSGAGQDFTIARYTAAGVLDTTFGSSGFVRDGAVGGQTYANGIGIQSDGKIVVTGYARFSTGTGTIVRVDAAGALDATFGSGGIGGTCGNLSNVAFGTDGSIVSTAETVAAPNMWEMCGVSATGTQTFALRQAVPGAFDSATAVAFQSDGKLVVVGSDQIHGPAIARFAGDGSVDPSFGTNGLALPNSNTFTSLSSVVVQGGGGIVVAGYPQTSQHGGLIAQRFTSQGTLDTTFGTAGLASAPFTLGALTSAVAATPDGKLVVAGIAFSSGGGEIGVARFTADGAIDTAFGTSGTAQSSTGGLVISAVQLVAVQPDGAIVVFSEDRNSDFLVVRFTADGAFDTSFGAGGSATLARTGAAGGAYGLALQPDGAIVVAYGDAQGAVHVARLDATGAVDPSFGTSGIASAMLGNNDYLASNASLLVLPGGDLELALASASDALTESAVLLRFTATGTLASSQTLPLSRGSSALFGAALDGNGRLVTAGRAWTETGGSDFAVLRFVL